MTSHTFRSVRAIVGRYSRRGSAMAPPEDPPPPPPPVCPPPSTPADDAGGSGTKNGKGRKDDDVGESVIRLMTRLSLQHGAVNLSQGFPNEPPPLAVRAALARGVLTGSPDGAEGLMGAGGDVEDVVRRLLLAEGADEGEGDAPPYDELNQYSPPMGRPDVRSAISRHYARMYGYGVDPNDLTVTLGATEAVASALRTVGAPGDRAVLFEPYHEIYPSQARIFWMKPECVTLRENLGGGTWSFDRDELEGTLRGGGGREPARVFMLNTPHNPTGKVFTREELRIIADLCHKYGTYIITDEIYEHMTYGGRKHILLPEAFPQIADQTFVCNSIGKSASATGWRLGWCLHPPAFSSRFRGVHDQLVVMSPHPQQYAALTYLDLPDSYFRDTLSTRYLSRLKRLAASLRAVGFGVSDPEGAYYLFARYRAVPALADLDPWDAAMRMVEDVGVACVPGDNFYGSPGALGKGGEAGRYLRFAACRSIKDVEEACRRIERHLGGKGLT